MVPELVTPRRGARIAWLAVGAMFALAALVAGAFSVLSLLAHAERIEHFTLDADSVATVDVHVDSGTVTVIGSDTDSIVIDGKVSDGWVHSELTAHVSGDVARVRGRCPVLATNWCRTDVTVEVPADASLVVRGAHDTVRISGVAGAVDVSNRRGRIELADLSGPLTVRNDHGRIEGHDLSSQTMDARNGHGRIDVMFIAPPDSVAARTSHGRIDVVVPDVDDAYQVHIASDHGSTETLVRTDPSSPRHIEATSDHGSVSVRTSAGSGGR